MRILYCGPYFSEYTLNHKRASNQAAARWSWDFTSALSKIADVEVVNHCPEQRWPAGKAFWQDDDPKWFRDELPVERISYPNIVGLKDVFLTVAYERAVSRKLRAKEYDWVICYNSLHPFHVAAMRAAKKAGVKTAVMILDGDDPRRDNWKKLLHDNRYADAVVLLSWWMYKNYPRQAMPLFHMDGGADAFSGEMSMPEPSTEFAGTKTYTLVHTGALDYWRGLRVMRGLLECCKRQDVRFVFCGKCNRAKRLEDLGYDERVEERGFVSKAELDEICSTADVFLNVRDPEVGDNIVNYPSKIPQYLSWGRPVVSTWVDSFSPDYRNVLSVEDTNTPEGLASKIDEVLAWDVGQKQQHFEKIKSWFLDQKDWNRQVSRLASWMDSVSKREAVR